jgi:hypothetical protein
MIGPAGIGRQHQVIRQAEHAIQFNTHGFRITCVFDDLRAAGWTGVSSQYHALDIFTVGEENRPIDAPALKLGFEAGLKTVVAFLVKRSFIR